MVTCTGGATACSCRSLTIQPKLSAWMQASASLTVMLLHCCCMNVPQHVATSLLAVPAFWSQSPHAATLLPGTSPALTRSMSCTLLLPSTCVLPTAGMLALCTPLSPAHKAHRILCTNPGGKMSVLHTHCPRSLTRQRCVALQGAASVGAAESMRLN